MSITLDTSKFQYEDRPNTDYFCRMSYTVASGADILIVFMKAAGRNFTSATWNGTAMTELYSNTGTNIAIYYILNPESGTYNIQGNETSYDNGVKMFAASFFNVSDIGAFLNNWDDYSTSISTNITPTETNSVILDFLVDGVPSGVGSGQTQIINTGGWDFGSSTKPSSDKTQKSMSWTFSATGFSGAYHYVIELIDVNQPSVSNSNFFQLFN